MSAIGYCRASTNDQHITLEMQEQKIRAYAALKDITVSEIIIDRGKSGKELEKREGIQKVIYMAQNDPTIDAIIIYKLDRACRSTEDALKLATIFKDSGVSFHSICENIDTDSPVGKFFYTILAAFSELERNVISERTSAALQYKKSQGKPYCKNSPYGYKKQDGLLVCDEKEQEIIEGILYHWRSGKSISSIANILNRETRTRNGGIWYPQQIKNVINNNLK